MKQFQQDDKRVVEAVNDFIDLGAIKTTRKRLEEVLFSWIVDANPTKSYKDDVIYHFRKVFDFIDDIDQLEREYPEPKN